ncbi:PREDICTED: probable E3 ubiquitin-protein ligase RHC2A [Camelina sativa]|uniref:RING-type E3 ubiquitin transferase n=1 Tax=Camelina sativa TaxID=90675 RepID=A0ABM0ZLA0_CAMSA|nr:PREDICTED: probable E3 ubiquitin-protein ligase RHC2A [Camelina sativa]XP_010517328.1 PREDICTED: probable E3 ubiquitin-protein ligase RHC2A [Camelina sativa]XP_010517329.1 PREDICTED: probable E3 ubiquitin-protein ligase RHC2A [Camelina sativa]
MASGSYWCYSCSRFVWVSDSISCPDCDGGFLEHIQESLDFTPSDSFHRVTTTAQHRSPTRFPLPSSSSSMHASTADNSPTTPTTVTRTRSSNRSPNPVIVLRGSGGGGAPSSDVSQGLDRSAFQMYYDDGTDSGLRPLPPSMTEFLLGSGFDRLLDQISQIELNTNRNNRSCDHPPASKSAIEALPVIEIDPNHLQSDSQSHCAVCKENFVLKSSAREMPCNHIYHPDCILPWLAIRNSCPVCRHELPPAEDITDGNTGGALTVTASAEEEEDSAAGLTIWRLPGGGFAVGRIPGGWRGGDRMMPVVYTEVDGGRLGDERLPRRVAWGSRRGGRDGSSREGGGGFAGRIMRLFGCFSGSSGSIAAAASSGSGSRIRVTRRSSFSLFSTSSSSSRRRNWLA